MTRSLDEATELAAAPGLDPRVDEMPFAYSDLLQVTVPDDLTELLGPAPITVAAPVTIEEPEPASIAPAPAETVKPATATAKRSGQTVIPLDVDNLGYWLMRVMQPVMIGLSVVGVGYMFVNWISVGYITFWAGVPSAVAAIATVVGVLVLLRLGVLIRNQYAGFGSRGTATVEDSTTQAWIQRMEDPNTKQAFGTWVDGDGSKCAVGHLLDIADPKGFKGNGFGSRAYRKMAQKYGRGTLSKVIAMNDSGTPLQKIANYVRRRTAK